MNGTEMVVSPGTVPAEFEVEQVKAQVQKVQVLMEAMMVDGEHYGTIPGTTKKTLLKPGAEKLGFMFRLGPQYDVEQVDFDRPDLPPGHREVKVKCTLRHLPTDTFVAEGLGSCSTLESKYRYREDKQTETLGPVSRKYWDINREYHAARNKQLADEYGPGNLRTKKIDGQWVVIKVTGTGEQKENPDIADQYNTVLKMAKKRAHTDAILAACAASDIFTQDMDDHVIPPPEVKTTPVDNRQPPPDSARHSEEPTTTQLLNTRKADGKPVFKPEEVKDWSMQMAQSKGDTAKLDEIRDAIETRIEESRKPTTLMDEVKAKAGEQAEIF